MLALAAFWTIRMNVRQQRAAYRPELALLRTMIRSTRGSEELLPRLWTASHHAEPDHTSDSVRRLFVAVSNVGLGTANGIRVKWSFPITDTVQEVNEIAGNAGALTYERGLLNFVVDDKHQVSSLWRNQQRGSIDYIMPASIETVPTPVMVPHAYALVVSAMVFFCARMDTPNTKLSLPVLRLDKSYEDIGQRSHSTSFDVSCEIGVFNGDGEIEHGYFKHRRLV